MRFEQLVTRFVNFELTLQMPALPKDTQFEVIEVWFRPSGEVMARTATTYTATKGTSNTIYLTSGRGNDEMGKWRPGTYRLDIYVEGDKIVSGQFEIVP